MRYWKVTVEDKFGIIAQHIVEAIWPSDAIQSEVKKGFTVLRCVSWNK
jgi:hypothetical protein